MQSKPVGDPLLVAQNDTIGQVSNTYGYKLASGKFGIFTTIIFNFSPTIFSIVTIQNLTKVFSSPEFSTGEFCGNFVPVMSKRII